MQKNNLDLRYKNYLIRITYNYNVPNSTTETTIEYARDNFGVYTSNGFRSFNEIAFIDIIGEVKNNGSNN